MREQLAHGREYFYNSIKHIDDCVHTGRAVLTVWKYNCHPAKTMQGEKKFPLIDQIELLGSALILFPRSNWFPTIVRCKANDLKHIFKIFTLKK